ncbi:unnamed protein product, partial [Urochloa humidicola]
SPLDPATTVPAGRSADFFPYYYYYYYFQTTPIPSALPACIAYAGYHGCRRTGRRGDGHILPTAAATPGACCRFAGGAAHH